MIDVLFEIISPDRRFRATARLGPQDTVVVDLWKYLDEEASWTMLRPPSVTATRGEAEKVATSRLEDLSGVLCDAAPTPPSIEWIRGYTGDDAAAFVTLSGRQVLTESGDELRYDLAIIVSGYLLLREVVPPHEWWMGTDRDGTVKCWASYGTSLSHALDAL